jgi:hypothetical protein
MTCNNQLHDSCRRNGGSNSNGASGGNRDDSHNGEDNGDDGEDKNNDGGNGYSGGGGVSAGGGHRNVGSCCSLPLVAWSLHTLGIIQICLGINLSWSKV